MQELMFSKDFRRILKLAHLRNWDHHEKWNNRCPVCTARDSLRQQIQIIN